MKKAKATMDRELKKKIQDCCIKYGRPATEMRLMAFGLSSSMAQKLVSDNYPSEPKGLQLKAILAALEMK